MKTIVLFIALVLLFSCYKRTTVHTATAIPDFFLQANDTAIHVVNGVYYYQGKLFSGYLMDRSHHRSFLNGKEEGWQYLYYADGAISEKRYYEAGEKQGVHTGWWNNGAIRFEYHFNKGAYDGDYKEWYASGQLYKYIHYTDNIDDWGKGWRENGKGYMNYVMKDGRRYGLINSTLCYTVK